MSAVSNRIPLPILDSEVEQQYAKEATPPSVVWNCNSRTSDEPLDFNGIVSQRIVRSDAKRRRTFDEQQRVIRRNDVHKSASCSDRTAFAETSLASSGFSALIDAYGDADD
jgi:hypothetical protein